MSINRKSRDEGWRQGGEEEEQEREPLKHHIYLSPIQGVLKASCLHYFLSYLKYISVLASKMIINNSKLEFPFILGKLL